MDDLSLESTHEHVVSRLRGPNYQKEVTELSNLQEGDDPAAWTICFNVAEYTSRLWGMGSNVEFFPSDAVEMTFDELSRKRGVFALDLDLLVESHALVIWIRPDTVWLYQGYGGMVDPLIFEEDHKTWFGRIASLENCEPIDRYNILYDHVFRLTKAECPFYSGYDYMLKTAKCYQIR